MSSTHMFHELNNERNTWVSCNWIYMLQDNIGSLLFILKKKYLVKELKCNSLDTLIEYIVIKLSSFSYAMKFIAFKKEVLHFYQIY
jgi:hypothetical protein